MTKLFFCPYLTFPPWWRSTLPTLVFSISILPAEPKTDSLSRQFYCETKNQITRFWTYPYFLILFFQVATNILTFNLDFIHLLISIQQSKICPNNCASPQNSHSAQWQSNYLENPCLTHQIGTVIGLNENFTQEMCLCWFDVNDPLFMASCWRL